ncbi:MAG: glycosyltransferase family 87 protein, partial [Ktedonobacterales bacterium]
MLETTPATGSGGVAPGPRRTEAARLALALSSLAVLVVVSAQWLLGLYRAVHSIAGRYDFSTYYAAAYALRHDPHVNIYDPAVLAHAGAAANVLVQPPLAYTYPPFFAIVLSPFTLLSFRVLSRLWLFGNAALWLAVTLVLAREILLVLRPVANASVPVERPATPLRATTLARLPRQLLRDDPWPLLALALAAWLCLSSAPAAQTLLTGQINLLVLAPLALVPLLLRRGHDRWAGAAIALATMLKFTPALLIVYLLLRRRWQAALAAVATLAALALASALVVGPGVALASIPQALHVGTGDASLGHNEALLAA